MASYTALEDLDLPALCAAYGLRDPHAWTLKGGAANSSFRLGTAEGEYVLTVLDNHDRASAERLAEHTRAFFDLGVPTAQVIPNTEGRWITMCGPHPILLKRWIDGQVLDPLPEDMLPAAGTLLCQLHELPSKAVDVPVNSRRLSGEQESCIDDFKDRDFAKWLTGHIDVVKEHEARRPRPAVLCHGDLFADNLICRPDGSLSVIDWETVSLDDPLLDLGMAAVGLAQQDGRLCPRRLGLLVDGYTTTRTILEDDLAELPTEIVHAALIIAFHRYYRHNVRFPNAEKADIHLGMVDFVASVHKAF